jgi:hypothetical protein
MKNFLCLMSPVRRELDAALFLSGRGIETYAPLVKTSLRLGSKLFERRAALFPTYFFAEEESFYKRRAALGGIVYPYKLKSQIIGTLEGGAIDEIRARERDGFVVLPSPGVHPEMPFLPDEKVILNGLSMINIQAIFKEYIPEKERVLVLLNMLGREQVVPFSINDVVVSKLAYA